MKLKICITFLVLFAAAAALGGSVGAQNGDILYVKPNAGGDCETWARACDLQTALELVKPGDVIWAAGGKYIPTDKTDPLEERTATYQLKSGVTIIGGFDGTETARPACQPGVNETTLSGDIGTAGDVSDNSYHVVIGSGTDATAVLDCFTISGGKANVEVSNYYFGGGLFISGGNPTLIDIAFSGNSAKYGGGMYVSNGDPTLERVTFSGNQASVHGGGMANYSGSDPTLVNVVFSGNNADSEGGGMYNEGSSPTLTNVTFGGNNAWIGGCGGMYNANASNPTVTNSILWGNFPNQIANDGTSSAGVTYSDVEDGYTGTGNIDDDPLFVDAYDDLRLQLDSPAIDAGNNDDVPAAVTTDLGGHPRFAQVESVPDTGAGTPPIVDMGAYEAPPDIIYVDEDATGDNNGSSWIHAFTDLQDAFTWALDGVQIWVAEGTYKPGTHRWDIFWLVDGVEVYGGFEGVPGTEGNFGVRDWETYLTILSGDIGVAGDNGDNSYHVVKGDLTRSTTILDGFRISDGNADGGVWGDKFGGGLSAYEGDMTLVNLVFTDNAAVQHGGGLYINSSSPTLTDVTFSGNEASFGGGMDNNASTAALTNVTFSGNEANNGGGMNNWNDGSPTLTNVTFSGNQANNNGGGIYSDGGSVALNHCTVTGNTADGGGGGIYAVIDKDIVVKNSIIGGNHVAAVPNNCGGPITSWGYNLESGTDCGFTEPTDLQNTDPVLGPLADNGGATMTHALLAGSPAIDAGDCISVLPASCSTPDLAIPDNNPAGVSDSMVLPSVGTVFDLNVFIDATHTYVWDLVFSLEHVDSGTSATLIDRPLCSGDDIRATIDDEGTDGNAETMCNSPPTPALFGRLVGGDPPDDTLLSAFDGEDVGGTWTLAVSDQAGFDIGTLDEWCVIPLVPTAVITSDQRGISRPQGDSCDIGAYEATVDFGVSKSVDDDTADPGQLVTYTIVVSNSGALNATATLISDTLPADLTFAGPVTLEPPQPGADRAEDASDLPDLASGVTINGGTRITVTFPVSVNIGVAGGTTIVNTVDVTSDEVAEPHPDSVALTVNEVPPVAGDDAYSTDEDVPLPIAAPGVLDNDDDLNGDALSAVLDTDPISGTLALDPDGSFTYTPTLNLYGVDSFTYYANDGTTNSNLATVTITVTAVNDPPVAVDDVYSTDEETDLTVEAPGVLENDTDPDAGDTLSITGVYTESLIGTLIDWDPDGSFHYTPTDQFQYLGRGETVTETFTYTVTDDFDPPLKDSATVSITITGLNDAPIAFPDTAKTGEDTPRTIPVLGNDDDPDTSDIPLLFVAAVGVPDHGGDVSISSLVNISDSVTYTPTLNFNGQEVFTYTVSDGELTDTTTVAITVGVANDPPNAEYNTVTTREDTLVMFNVLDNDNDPDGDSIIIVALGEPQHGAATYGGPIVTYTPTLNFNGNDVFTYTISDGELEDTAEIEVVVESVNDVPVLSAILDHFTDMNEPAGPISFMISDVETPADDLAVTCASSNTDLVPESAMHINRSGAYCTLTINPTLFMWGTSTITLTVSDGTDHTSEEFVLTVIEKPVEYIYLPHIFKPYLPPGVLP